MGINKVRKGVGMRRRTEKNMFPVVVFFFSNVGFGYDSREEN